MPLTAEDINRIKTSIEDLVGPKFDSVDRHLVESAASFTKLQGGLEELAASTNRKFHTAFTDIAIAREDLNMVKRMVAEHGLRLAQLESQKELE